MCSLCGFCVFFLGCPPDDLQALAAQCQVQQHQLDAQASGEGLEASQRVVLRALSTQLQQLRSQHLVRQRMQEACHERMATLATSLQSLPPCQWVDLVNSLLEAPLVENEDAYAIALPPGGHSLLPLFPPTDKENASNGQGGSSHALALCTLLRRQLDDVARAAEGSPSQLGALQEALQVVACTLDVLAGDVAQLDANGGEQQAPGRPWVDFGGKIRCGGGPWVDFGEEHVVVVGMFSYATSETTSGICVLVVVCTQPTTTKQAPHP